MSTDYLLGPSGDETPHEYLMRLMDRVDVDPVTRCPDANYGPSPKIAAAWQSKIEWLRFEQKLWQQCCEMRESLWEVVADLLIQGKAGQHTREQIKEAIRLEIAVGEQVVDDFELIDFVTMLKGF